MEDVLIPLQSQAAVGKNGHFPACLGELVQTIPQFGPTDRWQSDRDELLSRHRAYIDKYESIEKMTSKRARLCRAALERFGVNHIGVGGDQGAQLALDAMRAPFNAPRPMRGSLASTYPRIYGGSQYFTHLQRNPPPGRNQESADHWWRRQLDACDPADHSLFYVTSTDGDA
jgi:hypothetical protein